jgi:hypothetical protein
MLEDNWRKALEILTTMCIPPLPLDDAISVLKGNLTFVVGEQGQYLLTEQDPTCPELQWVQSTENWQKAGILSLDGFFYLAALKYPVSSGRGYKAPVLPL